MEHFDWPVFCEYLRLSALGAGLVLLARVPHVLGRNPVPPEDAKASQVWKLRRVWFVVMEGSSFPSIAAMAAMGTMLTGYSSRHAFLAGALGAAVGWPFLVSVMRDFVRKRADVAGTPNGGENDER